MGRPRALADFDPLVAEWFETRFGQPTEPQTLGWPEIRAGRDVLISAPTGSGKTLSAFLICIDQLVTKARNGGLGAETAAVYVSPLKALSNDIRKNLEAPLAEIRELACQRGVELAPITTAVRTGDTPAYERQRMVNEPPHILVTTPESLFILLTAEKGRRMLRTARTLVLDEIHAVADDKRGSHLALSIARLEALVAAEENTPRLQRIGLSATVKPIEQVASFLSPRFTSEGGAIVQVGHRRAMDLAVEVPKDELGPVATNEMWAEIYDRLAGLIREHRTTLIFVNTRRLSERITHHLEDRLGENGVLAHHGSLSRQLRLDAEQRLKNGQLRAVVATASLELGIDIGTIDLVCQIGSPRSIAVALQRVGRSGHWVGAMPKGRLFATTRDELIECAALVSAIRQGDLDRLEIPEAPLDVLAQQIVAMAACEDFTEDDLYGLVQSSYPYRDLPRGRFNDVIEMLSEGISTSRGRSGAYLHRDQVNGRVTARRGARLAAITSGGAIPDNAQYLVVAEPEGTTVGSLDEDFAVESMAGDIFLLGTTSWRIRRIEPGRVRVEDAHGAAPTIPFWRGEAPGRTAELSAEISRVREEIVSRANGDPASPIAREFLANDCGLDPRGALQAVEYVIAGRRALGALPTSTTVVAERFFDEAGGMQLIVHALFGSRINRAWGLALRKRFCRSFNLELQAAATDNGIVISLSEQHAFPLDIIFQFLTPQTLEHILTQAMLDSPMFTARWRWNVSRALAVLRFAGGRKVPPPIQRMRSDDLLAAVFPDQAACAENLTGEIRIPKHPLVDETISDCLHEAMDLDGLARIIAGIQAGEIRTVAIDTAEPSPFCHEILNSNPYAYLDDAPLEERRARAVQMRRSLGDVIDADAALDAEAIAQVADEAWPLVRDADELHDALLTLVTLPPAPEWEDYFAELVAADRATTLTSGDTSFWVAAERLGLAQAVHEESSTYPPLEPLPTSRALPDSQERCAAEILRGWMDSSGPATATAWADQLGVPLPLIESALAALESEGQVLRGRFTPEATAGSDDAELEWCNRRILARIHRLTLGRLRREIEPVSTTDFMRFLCRWQHVVPGSRLHGVDGTLQIVKQLEGYEVPAAAWEEHILPRRVADYNPEYLDRLCLAGEIMWGRLSPHPAFSFADDAAEPDAENGGGRRVRPTRAAPIALFERDSAAALLGAGRSSNAAIEAALSHPAREILTALESRGASFFNDLVRSTRRLPSEIEEGLWELVTAGLVTADGFENLRSLTDPKRRRGEGRGRTSRPRHAAGRWTLLTEARDNSLAFPNPTDDPSTTDISEQAPAVSEQQALETHARRMLNRWGVVFRDLVRRESLAPAWRDLLTVLRRMESRGEIRGGRFVQAFVGEQFALPDAVELLRAVRRQEPVGEEVQLSAADPLNLTGILLPGDRVPASSNEPITLVNGVPRPEHAVVAIPAAYQQ